MPADRSSANSWSRLYNPDFKKRLFVISLYKYFEAFTASAGIVDQTPPVFAEHRKPKKFDQVAPDENDDSKLSQQLLLTVIKFESATNLRQLKGWSIGSGLRWSV